MNNKLQTSYKHIRTTILFSGLISVASLSQAGGMNFSTMDSNADGSVTEQEFNSARATNRAEKAAQGRPMRGIASAPQFTDLDTDQNGVLSESEFSQAHQQRMQQMQSIRKQDAGQNGMGQGKHLAGKRGKGNPPHFSDCDLNGDNNITREEFYAARNKRIAERASQGYQMRGLANAPSFEQIDVNADGNVSQDEFMMHRQQHRKTHGQGQGGQHRFDQNDPRFGQK